MFSISLNDQEIDRVSEMVASNVIGQLIECNVKALEDLWTRRFLTDLKSQDVIRGQNDIIRALSTVNTKLNETNEVLELHLQIATVRAGLEKSDQGAYDSLLLGLKHMRKQCNHPHSGAVLREFDAVSRKIDGLIKELDMLRQKALIDALIIQINTITSVSTSKRERKRVEPG